MKQLYNYLFRFKKLSFKERLDIHNYFEKHKLVRLYAMSPFLTSITVAVSIFFIGIFTSGFTEDEIVTWILFLLMAILIIGMFSCMLFIDELYLDTHLIFKENNILTQQRAYICSDLTNIDYLIQYFFETRRRINNPILNVFEFKNGVYLVEYIERIKQDSELSKLILATREIISSSDFNNVPKEVQIKVIEEKALELLVKANEKISLNEFLTIDTDYIETLNEKYETLKMSNKEDERNSSINYKLKADSLSLISKKENEKELSKLIDEVFSNENNLNRKYKISDKIKEILGEKSPKLIENTVVNYNSDYFLSKINKVRELVE